MTIGTEYAQLALRHLEKKSDVETFSTLAYPIVKSYIEVKNQIDALQKRNTELVEENRLLRAYLKAASEGTSYISIDSFGNIEAVNIED